MEEDVYKKELKQLQQRLGELHNRLYRKKVPVIIAYEGWDAAGKGGNINGLREHLIRVDMRFIRLQVPSRMRKQDIICGVSGQGFRVPGILQSLTERGMGV